MNVYFIDTSVFLNIINLKGRNEKRSETMSTLDGFTKDSDKNALILPFATIIETGNHIAHCDDGHARREAANLFSACIINMVRGNAPWTYYGEQLKECDLLKICGGFPDDAMRGMGFGDASIIQAYEKYKANTPGIGHIEIWSFDNHLMGYREDLS